jgi:4-amino-4-deoxy-L-arabinose transferase-like glycosyltransferase
MNNEETSWRIRNVKIRSGVSFFSHQSPTFGWKLLAVFLLLIYVPFLGNRVIRTAGDDKVYVSQAVEMAAQGSWFMQTLGNEPNYYKGPMHYIFLRMGMGVFGDSMWATVWMNLVLVILAAIAIGAIVHRNMREFEGWGFWAGVAFAVNAGIFSHMFASQMELEMAAFFVFGLYFLDRSGPGIADLKFWVIAGLAGWLKSPLHAVFLGSTAILFWAWQGELWPRLRRPSAWASAIVGIAVCGLGYLPPFLMDGENWWNTYVLRETFHKPSNGAPWHYPIIPLFTYSLLPWMFPAFVAFADGISRLWRKERLIKSTPGSKRVVALGVCLVIPSVLFFLWHGYRGQNYNLPTIGGLFLVIAGTWATRAEKWNKAYGFSLGLTAVILFLVPILFTVITRQFDPMPFWWSSWLLPLLWVGALFTARGFWREGVTFQMARPASLARRSFWFFVALGALTSTLGEREMVDVRHRIFGAKKDGENLKVSYYNLQKNIWSEWGYLNFQIPYPVSGLFNEADLFRAVRGGELILVPGDEWLEKMKAAVDKEFPGAKYSVEPWRRWKTKGKNAEGVPVWRQAWDSRDLSKLEKHFYMVRVTPAS